MDENPDVVFAENDEFKKRLTELRKEITEDLEKENEEIKNKENKNEIKDFENEDENAARIQNQIEKLCANVDLTLKRNGADVFESAAMPMNVEKAARFSKANLAGAPPKVLMIDEKRLPYLIKISNAPMNGVWESDRITAAAYLIILEEKFGRQFVSDSAIVDYFGDYRLMRVRPQDRRKVFRAARKIRDIKKGKMPREKNIFLCEKCAYKEKCQVKAKTLFSKIFGEA
ncbi:CRISPR-associated protein Cas4 [Methanimicrococcus stummii]|nr:Dna2/Cas4 domain-containing protein [Methanimicrococcus sp. Es2]